MPLLAADVIGDGSNCGNGCGRNGGSVNNGTFRSFSGVMFKILHIKSNILNIKLDKDGEGHRMDVVMAVTARATTGMTSSDDGGGRGDGGCSDSGDGNSFDVGSSNANSDGNVNGDGGGDGGGDDNSNSGGGCGGDNNNGGGGGGHSEVGGHRQ